MWFLISFIFLLAGVMNGMNFDYLMVASLFAIAGEISKIRIAIRANTED